MLSLYSVSDRGSWIWVLFGWLLLNDPPWPVAASRGGWGPDSIGAFDIAIFETYGVLEATSFYVVIPG